MKKILIVEDDQLVANIYGNKFSREGFQVRIAPDGEAGLDLIHSFRPDAVILDLMLPKMTGVELMKVVRAEPDFARLPVIVLSNAYLTSMMQQAWNAGATRCLSKVDCTPKLMIEVVRSVLSVNGALTAGLPPVGEIREPARQPPSVVPGHSSPASNSATSGDADTRFQADMPATLAALRALLQGLVKSESEPARLNQIHELFRRIHALTGNAAVAGMAQMARMSDALEALLKELHEKPKNINASTLRTVALAIDFLGVLFEQKGASGDWETLPPSVLVVDDEAISRRAVSLRAGEGKAQVCRCRGPECCF